MKTVTTRYVLKSAIGYLTSTCRHSRNFDKARILEYNQATHKRQRKERIIPVTVLLEEKL